MKGLHIQLPGTHVLLTILGALIVGCLIFQLGLFVGYTKASFSYQWGENYHRNFGGPRGGFMHMTRDDDFMEGHGVFGQILTINGSVVTVKDQDSREISVVVSDKTVVKHFKSTMAAADLKVDDTIVIIGEPNTSGQIQAKFIRVVPPRPSGKTFVPRQFGKPLEWGHI